MSQSSVGKLWRSDAVIDASEYARMIPGSSVPSGSAAATDAVSSRKRGNDHASAIRVEGHGADRNVSWARLLLPHPVTEDRYLLFRSVAADQAVLFAACLVTSFFSAEWRLPGDVIPVYLVLVTLFGFTEGLYRTSTDQSFSMMMPSLAKSVLFAMALVFIATRDDTPFSTLAATTASSLAGLCFWRYRLIVRGRNKSKAEELRNVLIVGAGPTGRAVERSLRDHAHRRVVRGFVDDTVSLSADVLGSIDDLAWLARAEFIDEVILALPHQPTRMRAAAEIAHRNHLDIRAVLDLPADTESGAGLERMAGMAVVTLHREWMPNAALFLKRVLDVAGATVGLVLSAPLMAIVALLVWCDSPGPIIYSAERVGLKGRRFRCHKFRSMVTEADRLKEALWARNQREGPIFKLEGDPRITRIGRFIRRHSLDELPQLWNVLRGDMSLVGPRPHPAEEVNHYELQHYRRLDVRPGLTGLWQVTARKNPSFDLNIYLDLTYIENWSLMLDLRILLRTVRVLFVSEGS